MSLNEEFDELARRKLEERQFGFQEADWQDARKLIDAERGGGNKALWAAGALALLLIGGLAWYGTRPAGAEKIVATNAQVAPSSAEATASDQQVQNKASLPMDAPPQPNAPAAASEATSAPINENPVNSIPVHSEDRTTEAAALHTTSEKSTPRKRVALNTSVDEQPAAVSSKKNVPTHGQVAVPNEKANAALNSPQATNSSAAPNAPSTPTIKEGDKHGSTTASTTDPSTQPSAEAISTESRGAETSENAAAVPVVPTDSQGLVSGNEAELNTSPTKPGNTQQAVPDAAGEETDASTSPAHNDPLTQVIPEGAATLTGNTSPPPSTTSTSATTDSTSASASAPSSPGDSTTTAPPATTAPPLVPERAPWEVSIMGGLFSSGTKYSGSNSADWSGDINKANSLGFGAELMHMGRNFGIGAGVHYNTYAERLKTDALDRTTTNLEDFWYLMPVDTTVLVITDTINGTPPTYTGTSETTTVNVLTQGTDTTTTTERVREARNELNRVSYLEVPLLLDAHLVQGRWSFGLRGGPTIGLLTGRRGVLPAADGEGYLPFADQAFRELTFGYTAKAYVRYRFNAAWSVGIEPAMRGQLMNSLGSGELGRKANAKGVMLSLSYRLR